MKQFFTFIICLLIVSCGTTDNRYSDLEVVGNYGAEISSDGAISTNDMLAKLGDLDSLVVKVESEIIATCTMKGCWMNMVLENGEEMRVTFKDYAFFVPKEGMEGNMAVIEGVVKRTFTDVETLQHYAKDAGKSETEVASITNSKQEVTFEATGVVIYTDSED